MQRVSRADPNRRVDHHHRDLGPGETWMIRWLPRCQAPFRIYQHATKSLYCQTRNLRFDSVNRIGQERVAQY